MTWTRQTNGIAGWVDSQGGFGAGQYGDQMYGEGTGQEWILVGSSMSWLSGSSSESVSWNLSSISPITWT